MNLPLPTPTTTIDPVEAAMTAASALDPLSPSLDPESPAEANLEPSDPKPEVRKAREYAEAATAKRRAALAESKARQAQKEFKEQQAELLKEKQELEDLFNSAKGNKANLQKIMNKAGVSSIDEFARIMLDLDAEVPTPEAKADKALEEFQSLRKQLDDEKKELANQRQYEHSKKAYEHYVSRITEELSKDTSDKFELVKEQQLFPVVLDRCLSFLQANNIPAVDPEEELILISHCASELELELLTKAKQSAELFRKSNKLKTLLGITAHTDMTGSSDSLRDSDKIAYIDQDSQKVLDSISQDNKQQRSSKFITNDSTVSSRPTNLSRSLLSDSDKLLDELIKASGLVKPSF